MNTWRKPDPRGPQKEDCEQLRAGWVQHDPTRGPLKEKRKRMCFHWLAGKRRCSRCYTHPHWLDHYECWVDAAGKPYAIVGHPYGLSTADVKDIADVCAQFNFSATVLAESWYYPSKTVAVIIKAGYT